jgi:hypothetical protein
VHALSQTGQFFLPLLKVSETTQLWTDYITFFITVAEAYGSSFTQ